jgi:hypothetical protein
MNTKKSLGHFPFGSESLGKSDLSFIPNINGVHESETSEDAGSPFEVSTIDVEKKDMPASDDLVSSHLVERDVPVHDEPPVSRKKVASYYLEESLIDRLKAYSDSIDTSYSATVTEALEEFITDKEF